MNVRVKILVKYVKNKNVIFWENDFSPELFVSEILSGLSRNDVGISIFLSYLEQKTYTDNRFKNS